MRARHKRWALPFLEEHGDLCLKELPLDSPFYEKGPLYMEIGAGKGDFVVAMAAKGGNWLALERDISVSGLLAKKIIASELTNIHLMAEDFDDVYPKLKKASFAGIFLNFSDPWPKKKHWKRRLTTKERLEKMSALLARDGKIYFKTDNDSLYEFTKEEALKDKLKIELDEPNYLVEDPFDAPTEYERNFRAEGMPIHRLIIVKEEKPAK